MTEKLTDEQLVERLRVTTPDPLEKVNHRLRRYVVERLEAATTIEALRQQLEAAKRGAENARSILNSAYAAGYLQAECGLPEHKDAATALAEARAQKDICPKCMGTGVAGHPDSGATCDCKGGMVDIDPINELLLRIVGDLAEKRNELPAGPTFAAFNDAIEVVEKHRFARRKGV